MPDWNEGAIIDLPPRRRFHREVTPIWLVTACHLLGSRAPSLNQPFRYADLGCGAGFDALTVAATCPRAEVWGFDFNPAQIEAARDLALQAGLTNVRFLEVSFAAMAAMRSDELPQFDFMIADSVLSVISPENQGHIHRLVGRLLRPGGLAYLGYSTDTGWTGFESLQTLMRMLYVAGTDASDFAVAEILARLDRLRSDGASLFQRNPVLERHLADLRSRPAGDLADEFLNQEWHALMFADVADAMAAEKCDFLGRASLHENIAAMSVPPEMLPLLDEAASIRIRETMQDVAAATVYRRDIFRRGLAFPPVAEHHARLASITVAATDHDPRAVLKFPGKFPGTVPGQPVADPDLYQPLIAAVRDGPITVATVQGLGALAGEPIEAAADAVAMLIAAGYAHPVMPELLSHEAVPSVTRLNDAIIDAIARGEPLFYLVSPVLGAAIETNPLEALTIGALLVGHSPDDVDGLIESVGLAMRQSGRSVVRDGAPVADEPSILRELIARILQHRVPLFRALGVLRG